MSKRAIQTNDAPAAIGPYSQAIEAGGILYVSGQIPIDPSTGLIVDGGIEAQTRQVLKNLVAVLHAGHSSTEKVLKTTIYLKDMNQFQIVNGIYAELFTAPFPARATVEVARLPKDVLVEIDCIAKV